MAIFTGSGVAIVTPFTRENTVNFDKLATLIEWHVQQGTDAIIVCGTTGESPTLTDDEHKKVIECAVATAKKRVPVIAGSGSNDTAYAVQMSVHAEKVGADALLCITPSLLLMRACNDRSSGRFSMANCSSSEALKTTGIGLILGRSG